MVDDDKQDAPVGPGMLANILESFSQRDALPSRYRRFFLAAFKGRSSRRPV